MTSNSTVTYSWNSATRWESKQLSHPYSIPNQHRPVEKANVLIFTATKKILENQSKGKWAKELPRVVWSHTTSVCRATKFTPFTLLYGEEPVTPEDIKLCSARTKAEALNNPTEAESKDLLDVERMKAVKNLQSY
jgi:hypothetical protein